MLSDYSICIVNNKLLFAYFDYFLLGGYLFVLKWGVVSVYLFLVFCYFDI